MLKVLNRHREADARPSTVTDGEAASLALPAPNPKVAAVRRMAGFARTMLKTGLLDFPQKFATSVDVGRVLKINLVFVC